jgi:hypothetical protein
MGIILTGNGVSTKKDSYNAGKEASLIAKKQLKGKTPDILIVFASPKFVHPELLEGITKIFGDVPMVGGTTAGEISSNGFSTDSVVIMAIISEELEFCTAISEHMSINEKQCARTLAETLKETVTFDNALSLIVFPNGMGGDGVKVITGLNEILNNTVEIVGGCCGDDENFTNSFQYCDGKVYEDAIAGLLIKGDSSKFKTGIGVRSGFESIGNKMYCTASEGNVLKQIDNEPALDIYTELLGEERSKRFPEVCLEYPFGLIDEEISFFSGETEQKYFQLRCGFSVDYSEKTITLSGSVPDGSALTLTTGTRNDLIDGAKQAVQQASTCLTGCEPVLLIIFSCVGRKVVLGRRVVEETLTVNSVFGNTVPGIGFYTYGEIGPINKLEKSLSATKFHNETFVIWALGINKQ